jgi:DNA polymerase-3 subunit epsilon
MTAARSPGLIGSLKREWGLRHLADERWRGLWAAAPADEWVALHCETDRLNAGPAGADAQPLRHSEAAKRRSGRRAAHDAAHDHIVGIAALRIVGDRLLTSERLVLAIQPAAGSAPVRHDDDGAVALPLDQALQRLLGFIGSRPLVGYFLEYDLALLNHALQPLLGVPLPLSAFDVSAIFHAWRFRQLPPHQQQGNVTIDLRFATLMRGLGLPERDHHDPLDHAVMSALAFVKLRQLGAV